MSPLGRDPESDPKMHPKNSPDSIDFAVIPIGAWEQNRMVFCIYYANRWGHFGVIFGILAKRPKRVPRWAKRVPRLSKMGPRKS